MTADQVKQLLQLRPLELEGGFFRETYRSHWQLPQEQLPEGVQGTRSIGTAIYYMITPETFSSLHRLPGTEIFHCGSIWGIRRRCCSYIPTARSRP